MYLYERNAMKDIKRQMQEPTLRFQKLRGTYILDYECIVTKFQLVDVLKEYSLVEFMDDFGIRDRTVMFWHASIVDGELKIIVYDIVNKDIVIKTQEISEDVLCDWFLYDKEVLNDELQGFFDVFFHRIPKQTGDHTDDLSTQ